MMRLRRSCTNRNLLATLLFVIPLLTGLAHVPVAAAGTKPAPSASKGKRYYWSIIGVLPKASVDAALSNMLKPLIEAKLAKIISSHAQLAAEAPPGADPSKADAYNKMLAKAKIAGSYSVTVDITEATEEIVDDDKKPGNKRLVVHLAVHFLGERIPDKTIGFTADGTVTIKEDFGKTVRPKDREFVWASAVNDAIDDAIATSMASLSKPKASTTTKPKKR
jgi:hypothetical protein